MRTNGHLPNAVKISRHVIVIALALLLCMDANAVDRAAASKADRYALLVGIDDYKGSLDKLDGCVNDAKALRELLIEKFEFPPENVMVLTDAKATRDNILRSFEDHLIKNATKNTQIVFEFSGHGDQQADDDADEEDGMDETIVPADAGTPGVDHITDDEIQHLFARLTEKTKNVLFIFDSCHSGSVTRGSSTARLRRRAKVRTLSENSPLKARSANQSRSRGSNRDIGNALLTRSEDYVTISACQSGQLAGETLTGPKHGILTKHLLEALNRPAGDSTYRDLSEELKRRFANDPDCDCQEPQVEGELDRFVLGNSRKQADSYIRVLHTTAGMVTINAGASTGIEVGSRIAIYDPSADSLIGKDKLLAQASISHVEPFTAEFPLPSNLDSQVIDKAKIVLLTPHFGDNGIHVLLQEPPQGAHDAAAVKSLFAELQNQLRVSCLSHVTAVRRDLFQQDGSADWQAAVICGPYAEFLKLMTPGQQPSAVKECQNPSTDATVCYAVAPNGAPLFNFCIPVDYPSAAQSLASVLEKFSKREALKALSNVASPMHNKIKVSLLRVTGRGSALREEPMKKNELAGDPRLRVGDRYKFKIENDSDRSVYVTVLLIGTSGRIKVVYPPENGDEILPPGRFFKTREFVAHGPIGTDTFKFLITTEKAHLRFLEQEPIAYRATRGQQPLLKQSSGLSSMLLSSFGYRTREAADEELSPDAWDAFNRDVIVEPAKQGEIQLTTGL